MPAFFTLGSSTEGILLKVLVQLVIIIIAARLFAALFRRLGQPAVVGEFAAGLALGPSLLGMFFPEFSAMVFGTWAGGVPQWVLAVGVSPEFFHTDVSLIFTILAQLGLVFLLFLIGLEFDYEHLKISGAASGAITLAGMALPFALGWVLAMFIHPIMAPDVGKVGFALFMGTAMSITAIPILGRIMMELNLTRTRIGAITITAAAVDDAMGWILLATVTALVSASFSVMLTLKMLGLTVGFAILMIVILRPVFMKWTRTIAARGEMNLNAMAVLIVLLFLSAVATSLIGIFAIFGAFILGATLSADKEFREICSRKLNDFVTAFFLPIFFTYTGLRTDIGSLDTPWLWMIAGLVCLAAIVGKFGGCTFAAKLAGMSWRDSTAIGAMMNTRALMELIVINVGYDLGVIPKDLFCMLVIMALLTTVMTSPILLMLMRRDPELNACLAQSSFAHKARPVESKLAADVLIGARP